MVRLGDILEKVKSYNPNADLEQINRAYVYSAKAHAGHVRQSGEPYLIHPLDVAMILSEMKMDVTTILVGLLHDTVEDTDVTREDLEKQFGEEVGFLVESLTKISRLDFESGEEHQAENLRLMIISMARDIRVIMVKLADRLHNMRTLGHLKPEKQMKIAKETMDIYAPLANRLGISWMQSELEDLAFKYIYPEAFISLQEKVKAGKKEYETYIKKVIKVLRKALMEHGIKGEVTGRTKHLYSLYNKMKFQELPFEQIFDQIAFRIIVSNVRECYEILGIIHSMFKPIPGRLKDYIGFPKANRYQSIHTTVIGPFKEQMEVQIRSWDMHYTAEDGIAAHWRYKGGKEPLPEQEIKRFTWFKQILEELKDVQDPRELMETVRTDLFAEEVYVFTPNGDVRAFPRGATPIDFAYSIHTDVGHWCVGAKINGRIVPLKYNLKNGDMVEIITSKGHKPSKDWLKMVVTNSAKAKIRNFIKREEKERSKKIGEELLDRELRKIGKTVKRALKTKAFQATASAFGFHKVEDLVATVGYGKYSAKQVLSRVYPEEMAEGKDPAEEIKITKRIRPRSAKDGIVIDGVDDVMVRFAQCCNPLPGDEVVGIITRGRGISVHTTECPNTEADRYDQDRLVKINWDTKKKVPRTVRIKVTSEDVKGLLAEMTAIISARNINISHADIRTTSDLTAVNTFDVEVEDLKQLQELLKGLATVKGVIAVERMIVN
ncbi:MAG: bifunctional (p)ppGpp synthetase/guanosine-3',5'-bis(diphosphate) 3'-pyrophosphohydrolase [bacterium]